MIITHIIFNQEPSGDVSIDIKSAKMHKTDREAAMCLIFQKHLKAAMEEAVSSAPAGGVWAEGKDARETVNRISKLP
jgi:hypothetical protein